MTVPSVLALPTGEGNQLRRTTVNSTVHASRRTPTASVSQSRTPRLPRLNHGVRWTITRQPHTFQVRATRDETRPERLRVFDTATRDVVLKVTNRPGSDRLPNSDVLFELLRWTDPRLVNDLTKHRRGICWLLTETARGFEVSVRVRGPKDIPGPRVSARPLPLSPSSRSAAALTAAQVLLLAPRSDGGVEPLTAEALALAAATLSGH